MKIGACPYVFAKVCACGKVQIFRPRLSRVWPLSIRKKAARETIQRARETRKTDVDGAKGLSITIGD
jgi:hypothetical protein